MLLNVFTSSKCSRRTPATLTAIAGKINSICLRFSIQAGASNTYPLPTRTSGERHNRWVGQRYSWYSPLLMRTLLNARFLDSTKTTPPLLTRKDDPSKLAIMLLPGTAILLQPFYHATSSSHGTCHPQDSHCALVLRPACRESCSHRIIE